VAQRYLPSVFVRNRKLKRDGVNFFAESNSGTDLNHVVIREPAARTHLNSIADLKIDTLSMLNRNTYFATRSLRCPDLRNRLSDTFHAR
jgi:hypothetical protein